MKHLQAHQIAFIVSIFLRSSKLCHRQSTTIQPQMHKNKFNLIFWSANIYVIFLSFPFVSFSPLESFHIVACNVGIQIYEDTVIFRISNTTKFQLYQTEVLRYTTEFQRQLKLWPKVKNNKKEHASTFYIYNAWKFIWHIKTDLKLNNKHWPNRTKIHTCKTMLRSFELKWKPSK